MLGTPRVIRHKLIKCFGVGESDLEAMLPDLIRRGRDPFRDVRVVIGEGILIIVVEVRRLR